MENLLIKFREWFPEFSAEADSVINKYIIEAQSIYCRKEIAIIHLAAHLLTLDKRSGVGTCGGNVDGGSEVVIVGVTEEYKQPDTSARDSYYKSTPYGRKFLEFRKSTRGFSVINA
jgi:hypothetical protein